MVVNKDDSSNQPSTTAMAAQKCPFPSCEWTSPACSDELIAQLLKIHFAGVHAPTTQTTTTLPSAAPETTDKGQKFVRPTISLAGTSEDWSYFLTRWDDYKEATGITGRNRVLQLLECCDEDLRRDLIRTAGGSLSSKTEDNVLKAMKLLAVRQENTMVARGHLS